mmetsp:Transcript_45206/g.70873  ORF Transcript_45206/g.70873 Transcript_45206/m.70873 type:complete len:350 (+) Transcript_45206:88-1137(+)
MKSFNNHHRWCLLRHFPCFHAVHEPFGFCLSTIFDICAAAIINVDLPNEIMPWVAAFTTPVAMVFRWWILDDVEGLQYIRVVAEDPEIPVAGIEGEGSGGGRITTGQPLFGTLLNSLELWGMGTANRGSSPGRSTIQGSIEDTQRRRPIQPAHIPLTTNAAVAIPADRSRTVHTHQRLPSYTQPRNGRSLGYSEAEATARALAVSAAEAVSQSRSNSEGRQQASEQDSEGLRPEEPAGSPSVPSMPACAVEETLSVSSPTISITSPGPGGAPQVPTVSCPEKGEVQNGPLTEDESGEGLHTTSDEGQITEAEVLLEQSGEELEQTSESTQGVETEREQEDSESHTRWQA